MPPQHGALPHRDRRIIGLLSFFILMACTIELYWIVYADQLVARTQTDLFAYLFSLYGAGDNAYYDHVTPFTRGLETLNVFVTQPLNVWLIFAICRRKPYRHALQLTIASYLTYSVILYFWTAYLSDYAGMRTRNIFTFFMFYTPNLPWLCGGLYMVYDALIALTRHGRVATLAQTRKESGC